MDFQHQELTRSVQVGKRAGRGTVADFTPPSQLSLSTLQAPSSLGSNDKYGLKRMSTSIDSPGAFDLPKTVFSTQRNFEDHLPQKFDVDKVDWQESDFCQLCYIDFSVKVRKHHCRRCGKMACGSCSGQKRQLSKTDKKTHRICDACDTRIQNYKLERTEMETIEAQQNQIEILNDNLEKKDDQKTKSKAEYDDKIVKIQEIFDKKKKQVQKQEDKTKSLRRELERQNQNRTNLYATISNDEKMLQERDDEKNRLITQKSIKLTELADKELILHEKEQTNEQLRAKLEQLKGRHEPQISVVMPEKKDTVAMPSLPSDSDGDHHSSVNSRNTHEVVEEEKIAALEHRRKEKLKFMMEYEKPNRIEEQEYEGGSIISTVSDVRKSTMKNKSHDFSDFKGNHHSTFGKGLEEVDEELESEGSRNPSSQIERIAGGVLDEPKAKRHKH